MYYLTSIILIVKLSLILLKLPEIKSTAKSSHSTAYSSIPVTLKRSLVNNGPSVDPTTDPSSLPTLDPPFRTSFVSALSSDIYPHGNNGRSLCINSNGTTIYGPSDCISGEVMLLGNYVNLGIHNVASFGTESEYHSSYFNGQLGYIVDFDRKGWLDSEGNPRYAGDYVIPGAPLEGIVYVCIIVSSPYLKPYRFI